jgi:chloramphenicol 3-O phosphotransferase
MEQGTIIFLNGTCSSSKSSIAKVLQEIMDGYFIHDPVLLKSAMTALLIFNVLFVGVRCPVEVAEQRERDRGDRMPGLATAHIDLVHAHGIYDLDVDTSVLTAMECAEKIRERLLNGPPPNAFRQLQAIMTAVGNA